MATIASSADEVQGKVTIVTEAASGNGRTGYRPARSA